jgi:hypothetical protein
MPVVASSQAPCGLRRVAASRVLSTMSMRGTGRFGAHCSMNTCAVLQGTASTCAPQEMRVARSALISPEGDGPFPRMASVRSGIWGSDRRITRGWS